MRTGDGRRAITRRRGTRAIHARKENSKFGNERMRRRVVPPAALNSTREKASDIVPGVYQKYF
jgi:hypothetical protein